MFAIREFGLMVEEMKICNLVCFPRKLVYFVETWSFVLVFEDSRVYMERRRLSNVVKIENEYTWHNQRALDVIYIKIVLSNINVDVAA